MAKTVKVSKAARAKAVRRAAGGGALKLTANQRAALTRSAASGRFVTKTAVPSSSKS